MPAVSPARVPPTCTICVDSKADHYCRKQEADYFICRQCDLIFQHPLPTRTSMVEWADDAYASGAYRDYVEARPMKIRHFEDRLADVGARLRRAVCSTWAAPADTSWKSPPRVVSTCTAWSSRVAPLPPPVPRCGRAFSRACSRSMPDNGLFDVVSAFDLIEHVPDPRRFLRRCARVAQGREAR